MAAIVALALILSASNPAPVAQASVAKIQVGDKLKVVVVEDETYSGQYVVLDDGSVTGVGFGRLMLAGKTVEAARLEIKKELTKIFKSPTVSLVVVEQKKKFIFVTSLVGASPGPIEYQPNIEVRKVVTGIVGSRQGDEIEVRLFRDGQAIGSDSLDNVMQGIGEFGSKVLEPNDVVTLTEVVKHRIYVTGKVRTPGELRVREGTDALQAIALSGGTIEGSFGEFVYTVRVRRGANVYDISLEPMAPRFTLQPGDTVLVAIPEQIQVSVGGAVNSPGMWTVREGTDLLAVIQRSNGIDEKGSLEDILVVRKGESYIVDLSTVRNGESPKAFPVMDGDLVFVRRNEKRLIVLGFVQKPVTVSMEEGRVYRLADAVAEAGGPNAQGTYHRVYVGRKGEDGKVEVKEYKLDSYVRGGDVTQNPTLEPGDIVMVGEVKGMTLGQISTILSNALIIDSLFRRF